MKARCRKCGSRRTLSRHPDAYIIAPRCKRGTCNSRSWRPDRYRMTRETGPGAPKPCTCGEYHFMHRIGSGWCVHNPNITDDDRRERWETGQTTQRRWMA